MHTLKEEIFAKEIFAEFDFVYFDPFREIKFYETRQSWPSPRRFLFFSFLSFFEARYLPICENKLVEFGSFQPLAKFLYENAFKIIRKTPF